MLMAGLLWSWSQAQAASAPAAPSEPGHFLPTEPLDEFSPADETEGAVAALACRKPALSKTTVANLVFNEISDKDAPSVAAGLWPPLPHAAPRLGVVARGPQIDRAPLLRPPQRLA